MGLLAQLLLNGLIAGGVYALFAVAFGLSYRALRVFDLSYAAIVVLAAYVGYLFGARLGVPLLWMPVLVFMAGMAFGALLEFAFYRPFLRREASASAMLVASLGVAIVVQNLLGLWFGPSTRPIPRGITTVITVAELRLSGVQLTQAALSWIPIIFLGLAMRHTSWLRAVWAMGDQPDLVSTLGLPEDELRRRILMLSSALAALGAWLVVLEVGANPRMGILLLLYAAIAALTGGLDRYAGWVVGGLILALLESLSAWRLTSDWAQMVAFVFLIVVLMFRPRGILARQIRPEET